MNNSFPFGKCVATVIAAAAFNCMAVSCHCDHDTNPDPFKVGHILCTDGSVVSLCDFRDSGKEPYGVIFYVNHDPDTEGLGYAVALEDAGSFVFADSAGVPQGSSCDLYALDGNANTYALYGSKTGSPMAEAVYDNWRFGQSSYIPSVAQMRLLKAALDYVNPRIEAVGGTSLPMGNDSWWYWTSTEVQGQQAYKAWLYSLESGTVQETPKSEAHRVRPIVTVNR